MTTDRTRGCSATMPIPVDLAVVAEWLLRINQASDERRSAMLEAFSSHGSIEQNLAARQYQQEQRLLAAEAARQATAEKAARQYANALTRELHTYWRFTSLAEGISDLGTWRSVPAEDYPHEHLKAAADAAYFAAQFGFNVYRRLPEHLLDDLQVPPGAAPSTIDWGRLRRAVGQLIRFEDRHVFAITMAIDSHESLAQVVEEVLVDEPTQPAHELAAEPIMAKLENPIERAYLLSKQPYSQELPTKIRKILATSQDPARLRYALERHDRIMAYHGRYTSVDLVRRATEIHELVSSKLSLFGQSHRKEVADKLQQLESLIPDARFNSANSISTVKIAAWVVSTLQLVAIAESAQPKTLTVRDEEAETPAPIGRPAAIRELPHVPLTTANLVVNA